MSVEFIGYQEVQGGEAFPLFNVNIPGHQLHGSTVSRETLLKNELIPPYCPDYENLVMAATDLYRACRAVLEHHLGREHGEMLARAIDKAEGRVK